MEEFLSLKKLFDTIDTSSTLSSYSLSPEQSLIIAYLDAFKALSLLHSPDVANDGNLSYLFIMGSSWGANITSQMSLDIAIKPAELWTSRTPVE